MHARCIPCKQRRKNGKCNLALAQKQIRGKGWLAGTAATCDGSYVHAKYVKYRRFCVAVFALRISGRKSGRRCSQAPRAERCIGDTTAQRHALDRSKQYLRLTHGQRAAQEGGKCQQMHQRSSCALASHPSDMSGARQSQSNQSIMTS